MRYWKPLLALAVLAIAFAWTRQAQTPGPASPTTATQGSGDAAWPAFLPPEAHDTLALIARGVRGPPVEIGIAHEVHAVLAGAREVGVERRRVHRGGANRRKLR
ncbi:MAG TPA: hypothetical protein VF738_05330 [Rhodanobacter sp.]